MRSLSGAVLADVGGLGREADEHLARALALGRGRRGCRWSARGRPRGRRRAFLIFSSAGALGRKSATAAAMTTTSASAAASSTACLHLAPRCRPATTSTPARRRPVGGGDEGDVGAAGGGLVGEGVALLARRAVADEAHRVDGLAGAARGDERRVRPARSCGVSTRVDGGDDVVRLGQAAGALVAAGQAADGGLDDVHAAAAQGGEVVLHGRVLPHLGVHGRADDDRRRVASRVAVSRSSEMPAAYLPSTRAVAGATTMRSAAWPRRVCGMGSALVPQRVWAGSEPRAEKVTAPTKRVASSVRTGLHVGAGVDEPAAHLDRLVGGDPAARRRGRRGARPTVSARPSLGLLAVGRPRPSSVRGRR